MESRTLSVLVADQRWALTRLTGLLTRRGYLLDSLAAGPSEQAGLTRVTLVVRHPRQPVTQLASQLDKLVDVHRVTPVEPSRSIHRELMLVKVEMADEAGRARITELLRLFDGTTEQVGAGVLVARATGTAGELTVLLALLDEFGVREVARSGVVALEGCPAPQPGPADPPHRLAAAPERTETMGSSR